MDIKSIIGSLQDDKQATTGLFKEFYKWYNNLSEDDREAFDGALVNPEVSTRKLFYALKSSGVKWGDGAIYAHRTKLLAELNDQEK